MKNKLFKGLAIMFSVVIASAYMTTGVFAANTEETADSSGNKYIAGTDIKVKENVGNELVMAGQDVKADGVDVDGSAFMAGMNVSFMDSTSGASVFAAGMNVNIDADVDNNIWAAGQNITLGSSTKAKAAHVAAENVSVKGEYEYLSANGNSIIFDGVVDGDADFSGNNIVIGSNAKITGKITVKATEEPVVKDGAEVQNIEFQLVEKDLADDEDKDVNPAETVTKVASKTIGFVILSKIKKFIYWSLAFALMAVVFAVLFKDNLVESYEMSIKKKPLAFWLSGAIGFVFIPVALLILCITVIGAPLAMLIAGVYALTLCAAKVFTFSSLVRELIFTHTKKRLHPILETVLAVLIAALVKVIPVISGVVSIICKIYTLGYIIQMGYEKIGTKKAQTVEE